MVKDLFARTIALEQLTPPVAPAIPKVSTALGETRTDDYFWLRDKANPAVIEYLEAENRYTEAVMKPTESLQTQLYNEMVGRIQETDQTVPEKEGHYYYYRRTLQGRQYGLNCRRRNSIEAPEEVLLDQNALAAGKAYFRVGTYRVSPNGRYLAYTVDTDGSEVYTLYVKDLETDRLLADQVPNLLGYAIEWANDDRTIYYVTQDEAQRPYRVWKHGLGEAENTLVYEDGDALYFVGIAKTRDSRYLLIGSESKITSEVLFLEADRPGGVFKLFEPRQSGIKYSVDHRDDQFYVLTDEGAQNNKLMVVPASEPQKSAWLERIPHRQEVKLEGIDLFRDHLVVYERENALNHIRIFDLKGGDEHRVAFPEPVYTFFPGRNPEFEQTTLRFTYASMVTPPSVFDYEMTTRARTLKKQDVVKGFDPSLYRSERIYAVAKDGVQVPISLVYRTGLKRDGSNPFLLYGYGSYGVSIDPGFASSRISLLDRGFVFAIAHIRGGGDLGKPWYDEGKLLKKKNTFTDFIACAEHVIAEQYTSPEKLAIYGGSAGGLLMGAVINLRPELFRGAVAKVPFVDVINTMLDPTIPLTVTEYEEWGNPNEEPSYAYMKSYSPYDNVEAKAYPSLLITAGLNDPRVAYWEPAKWAAKLRKLKTDPNTLLLKTNMGAGHGGPSGRYSAFKEIAFEYAYLLSLLGV